MSESVEIMVEVPDYIAGVYDPDEGLGYVYPQNLAELKRFIKHASEVIIIIGDKSILINNEGIFVRQAVEMKSLTADEVLDVVRRNLEKIGFLRRNGVQ